MGAYSPAPVVTPAMHERIMREVIVPTVEGMAADGIPYTGFYMPEWWSIKTVYLKS